MGDSAVQRSWRPSVGDVALAVCLVAISVFVAVQAAERGEPGSETPGSWWAWLVIVVPSAMVAFRRSAPLLATPIAVLGQMAIWGLDLAEVFVAPLVLIYSVASLEGRVGRRVGVASAVALTAMTAVGIAVAPDVGADLLVLAGLSSAAALLLGTNAASQQSESTRLATDLVVARLEQETVRERAVVRERERIASELHDLVGHSLSVIAVRAEAAKRVGANRPDALLDAVAAIGDTARRSLSEVRRVLHAGLDDAAAELRPGASLADLPDLVERVAASGVGAELRWLGSVDFGRVDAATGAGVFRIVQESLTNVIKHAGPQARASVEVTVDDDRVHLEVVDNGRGPSPSAETVGGLGMTGMAERARFLGGTFDAGAAPGGGFRVRATIPFGDGR